MKPKSHPRQQLDTRPGRQHQMKERPTSMKDSYRPAGKLEGMVALITGGDSGIGRAVAVHFAAEGADVAINYLEETKDAETTREMVEERGTRCITIAGDVGRKEVAKEVVAKVVGTFGKLDILVNNAAEQHPQETIEDISSDQLDETFHSNIYAMFYLTQAALPHMKKGSTIINTSSVTAFRGSPSLLDYSATKGAITSFTRSLALNLAEKGIRVNSVAPGPIWTPLIPSTFPKDKVEKFGQDTPMKRSGEPAEVAPAFVFLASDDSSYITGQSIHVNGGEIVNA